MHFGLTRIPVGVEGWLSPPKIDKVSDDCQTRRYGPGGQKRV